MASFTPYSQQKQLHTEAPYRASVLTQPGNLKKALADAQADAAKTMMGVAHGIPSVFVTKLIASRKPDFIWIDVEHGMFDRLTLHDAIHAAQHHSEGHSLVIVRVPKHDEISLTTALDAGAAGIVIPHCESVEEVEHFKKEAFFGKHKCFLSPDLADRDRSDWPAFFQPLDLHTRTYYLPVP
jgi:4-hydroxy-2-oxoheptanedioate aldolase